MAYALFWQPAFVARRRADKHLVRAASFQQARKGAGGWKSARGKSFPSGHTGQAFFTATMLLRLMDGGLPVWLLMYVTALLVGISRMYLGMHYPRDVLAGGILGTFWGIVGMTVTGRMLELFVF